MIEIGRRWKRNLLGSSALGKVLGGFATRGRQRLGIGKRQESKQQVAARPPAKARRQGFALEAIEPRLLMSADISYATFTAAHEFTLKAEGGALNLYETGTSTIDASATLSTRRNLAS
jgi:hypothetical protein